MIGLPSLFKPASSGSGERGQNTLLLALLITDTTVQAGLWQIADSRIVIKERSGTFTYTDEASLLVETDKSLQELGKESENIEDVVLGLEFSWVDENGITEDKKAILKRLTKELTLKPVGFVVLTEALFHFLLNQDPQFSSLVIQYATDHVTVTIIARGELKGTERVGRSEDPAADVREATARLLASSGYSTLPPRVHLVSLMVSVRELQEMKQQLTEFDWKAVNPQIVHQPVVEVLSPDTMLEAVIQEGGKAVAQAKGYVVSETMDQELSAQPKAMVSEASPFADEFEVPATAVGEPVTAVEANQSVTRRNLMAQMAGMLPHTKHAPKTDHHQAAHEHGSRKSSPIASWLQHHMGFAVMGFAAGVLALFLIGGVTVFAAKQAVVQVELETKTVASDVAITLDPEASQSSPEELKLKAELLSETFTDSKSMATTGVKLVGEKAKGRVTISNKTNNPQTIAKGTQLKSGKFTFTLDEEIRVASASVTQSNDSETKTFGKTDASVTAVEIGADSNLAKDTELSVGSFSTSDVEAVVAEAFSGGASREVRVVAKEDQDALLADLKKKILADAEQKFKDSSSGGKYTIPTGQFTASKATYSAKVGDEVKEVKLDLEAEVSAVSYLTEDVASLVAVALKDKIPQGYKLSDQEPTILSQPSDEKTTDGLIVLDANISTQAVPEYDENALKQEISGQPPESAEAILRGKDEIKEAKVTLTPSLVKMFSNSLPKKAEAIRFEITQ